MRDRELDAERDIAFERDFFCDSIFDRKNLTFGLMMIYNINLKLT